MSNKKSIKRITARGIIGRYDYDINFMTSESNMKAIYSENGHGKTNLLRLISYITSYESEGLQKIFSIPSRILRYILSWVGLSVLKMEIKHAE